VPEPVDLVVDQGVFLDVSVGGRNVRLGLVVVVVGDKILDGVLGEEVAKLAVELGGKRLVVSQHESGALHGFDDLGHRERLSGSRHAQQNLVLLAVVETSRQLLDGFRLVPSRLEGRADLKPARVDESPAVGNLRVGEILVRLRFPCHGAG
jgi:hypothetical protein